MKALTFLIPVLVLATLPIRSVAQYCNGAATSAYSPALGKQVTLYPNGQEAEVYSPSLGKTVSVYPSGRAALVYSPTLGKTVSAYPNGKLSRVYSSVLGKVVSAYPDGRLAAVYSSPLGKSVTVYPNGQAVEAYVSPLGRVVPVYPNGQPTLVYSSVLGAVVPAHPTGQPTCGGSNSPCTGKVRVGLRESGYRFTARLDQKTGALSDAVISLGGAEPSRFGLDLEAAELTSYEAQLKLKDGTYVAWFVDLATGVVSQIEASCDGPIWSW